MEQKSNTMYSNNSNSDPDQQENQNDQEEKMGDDTEMKNSDDSDSDQSGDQNDHEDERCKPNDALMRALQSGVWADVSKHISEGVQVEEEFLDKDENSVVNMLLVASKFGNLECVKKLIELGATQRRYRAMIQAAKGGHIECFRFLMEIEYFCEASDGDKVCEVMSALKGGDFELVQERLRGKDIKDILSEWGGKLVNLLIVYGCPTSCIQTLKDCGVDVIHQSNDRSPNALECSIYSNNFACTNFLHQIGAPFDDIDLAIFCRDDKCQEEIVNSVAKKIVLCFMEWVMYVDNTSSMNILLKYLDSIDSKDRCGMTLLMWACQKKSFSWAEFLLQNGADPNVRSHRGDTALMLACSKNHYKMVELLLKYKIDINHQFTEVSPTAFFETAKENMVRKLYDHTAEMGFCSLGDNALLLACRKGHNDILDLLLKNNANPFITTPEGFNGIMAAVVHNNVDCVRKLLASFAPVDHKNRDGQTGLMLACALGHDEIVDVLLKYKANIDAQDQTGRTPLMHAALNNKSEKCVQMLLDKKANVLLRNKKGRTALMIACQQANHEVIDLLMSHGSDVDAQNVKGRSALMYSVVNRDLIGAKKLLAHGAAIDLKNQDGDTALMICCLEGDGEVLEFLIKNNANVNAQNKDGRGTIMLAALGDDIKSSLKNIPKLVDFGADIDKKSNNDDTALMFASQLGRVDIVEVLLKCGADVNAKNKSGLTAILCATNSGKTTCVKKLLAAGADLDITDNEGHSVFAVAIGNDDGVFKLLVDSGKCTDENGLKLVHRNEVIKEDYALTFDNLLLTMERGMFEWNWGCPGGWKIMCYAGVVSGVSPGTIEMPAGNISGLLLAYIMKDAPFLTYLLSNLYFFPGYLKMLLGLPVFKDSYKTDEASTVDKVIVEKVLTKPLSLQTWSFLAVSEAISQAGTPSSRRDRVNKLSLPEGLKRVLNFQTSVARTCLDDFVQQDKDKVAGDSVFSEMFLEPSSSNGDRYCLHCVEQMKTAAEEQEMQGGGDRWDTSSESE